MSLVARVSLTGEPGTDPEDFFYSALSVIFPDDTTNQHGDADHGVLYTSPHLPEPIAMSVTDPAVDADRKLFSHFLWNASLLLAKLVEAATLDAAVRRRDLPLARLVGSGPVPITAADAVTSVHCSVPAEFDIAGLATIELGAGTALPSIMSALLGAARVTITDYPSEVVMANLRANIDRNVRTETETETENEGENPRNPVSRADITVAGHAWGEFDSDVARAGRHAYDRVYVCDCLWMLWQHDNLRRSISWFLKQDSPGAGAGATRPRCWVIGGFHTGRDKVAAFFDDAALAAEDLAVEAIWERDCDEQERPWVRDRGIEDVTERKRWLVVAVLGRKQ